MPEMMSVERQRLIRAMGSRLELESTLELRLARARTGAVGHHAVNRSWQDDVRRRKLDRIHFGDDYAIGECGLRSEQGKCRYECAHFHHRAPTKVLIYHLIVKDSGPKGPEPHLNYSTPSWAFR